MNAATPTPNRSRRATAAPAARKGRRPPPPNETPHDRFLRLARPRMGRALYGIRLLANLAADSYQYTPEELEKMRLELESTKEAVFRRLQDRLTRKKGAGRGVGPPVFDF